MSDNIWLPWVDPGPRSQAPDTGAILAIIPSAGKDAFALRRLIDALLEHSGGEQIDPVIVLCPHDPAREDAVRAQVADRAKVISLAGPFNFCRSVNTGLRERGPQHGYAFLVNDDIWFTEGTVADLKRTLREQNWCAIGPWIEHPNRDDNPKVRHPGPISRNQPIIGAAMLWSLEWTDRIGAFDETFGYGWGLDEADYLLRARRLGALWGRDDRVAVFHMHHGTFGSAACRHDGPAHTTNVNAFRMKYGEDVGTWGGTHHWEPLPGIHVAMAGHNVEPWIERALDSIEWAMKGFRWILTYADDASDDDSLGIVQRWTPRCSADFVLSQKFPKANNAGQAKNRAIAMANPVRDTYPALMLMDSDDVMSTHRARHLLYQARDAGRPFAHGAFQRVGNPNPKMHCEIVQPEVQRQQFEGWMQPCTTVIHQSLIPEDGRLFDEETPICEDSLLFLQWWLKSIRSMCCPGPVLHYYYYREGSVMHRDIRKERADFLKLRQRILDPYGIRDTVS